MVRYEYQTCLRMSDTLKNDMTDICEKYKINESELMRRAVATFVEKLNDTPNEQGKSQCPSTNTNVALVRPSLSFSCSGPTHLSAPHVKAAT